jgi:hypothetical protein
MDFIRRKNDVFILTVSKMSPAGPPDLPGDPISLNLIFWPSCIPVWDVEGRWFLVRLLDINLLQLLLNLLYTR